MAEIVETAKEKMEAAIQHLNNELNNIRTGRANPSILDSVTVEVYGTQMRLRDIATISSPEPRQLLITPFDPSNTPSIGKGIEAANLGFQVITEANLVRINIPAMDENVRKEMVKQCKKKSEEGKVSIRNVRRDCNEILRKMKIKGSVSEDMERTHEKEIQDLTDKYCKEIDTIIDAKEKEVLEI